MNINFRLLTGWLLGVIGMFVSGLIMVGAITLPGVAVPNQLSDLTQEAEAEDYEPPTKIAATCKAKSSVNNEMLESIKKVTGKAAAKCDFQTDARQADTLWGAVAAIALVVIVLGALTLSGGHIRLNNLALLIGTLLVSLVGAIFWPALAEWMEDRGIEAVFFWRGFIATLLIATSGYLAHQWHKKLGHR